jgi:hypothetical protein
MTQFMELRNQMEQKMCCACDINERDYYESIVDFLCLPNNDIYYRNPMNLLNEVSNWFWVGETIIPIIREAIWNGIFEMKPTLMKLRRWDVMKNMIKYDPSNEETMGVLKSDFESHF